MNVPQAKKFGEQYQALSEEERQVYKDNAALEMVQYTEKMAIYKKEHPEWANSSTAKGGHTKGKGKKSEEARKKSSVSPPNPPPLPPAVESPAIDDTHVEDDSKVRSNKRNVGSGVVLDNRGSGNEKKKSKKKGKNEEAKKKSPPGQLLPLPPPPPAVEDTQDENNSEVIGSDEISNSGSEKKSKRKNKKKGKKKNEVAVNDSNVDDDPTEEIDKKKAGRGGIMRQGENELKPKRPLNAFMLYAGDVRGDIKAANADLNGSEIVSIVFRSFDCFAFFGLDHLPTCISQCFSHPRIKRLLLITKCSEKVNAKCTRTRPPRQWPSLCKNTVQMP